MFGLYRSGIQAYHRPNVWPINISLVQYQIARFRCVARPGSLVQVNNEMVHFLHCPVAEAVEAYTSTAEHGHVDRSFY